MADTKLHNAKDQLVDYIEFFYKRNKGYEVEYLVNNFFFDCITELRALKAPTAVEKRSFLEFSSDDKPTELFVKNSLKCFIMKFEKTRVKQEGTFNYTIHKKEDDSVENIFLGLEYSGNNDTDYKNSPSALALATFSMKTK
ncbi:hypothetical protein D3C87_67150 [compost metagenome]